MITTKLVNQVLKAADIKTIRVTKHGISHPWWGVLLEYQWISADEIEFIRKQLNDASINFSYGTFGLLMAIHPYQKIF